MSGLPIESHETDAAVAPHRSSADANVRGRSLGGCVDGLRFNHAVDGGEQNEAANDSGGDHSRILEWDDVEATLRSSMSSRGGKSQLPVDVYLAIPALQAMNDIPRKAKPATGVSGRSQPGAPSGSALPSIARTGK